MTPAQAMAALHEIGRCLIQEGFSVRGAVVLQAAQALEGRGEPPQASVEIIVGDAVAKTSEDYTPFSLRDYAVARKAARAVFCMMTRLRRT